jgi:transposase
LAIVSIDLADRKRAAVVTDHDSHVLGRRRVTARAWEARRPAGLRPMVCVQPLLVYRAREGEDLTFDKSDPKDALIIARLAAGLPGWATLVRSRAPDQVPGAG